MHDRRRRALRSSLVALITTVVLMGPTLAPNDPRKVDFAVALRAPSQKYPLGTDQFGRCLLSRLLHGGRLTIGVSLALTAACVALALLTAVASSIGSLPVRAIAGRAVDVAASLPTIVIAIAVIGVAGPSLPAAALGLAFTKWSQPSRWITGMIQTELRSGHVFAARAIGASRMRIATHELMPAIAGRLPIVISGLLAQAVLNLSALSFVGLGAQPPSPEWGAMLADARHLYFGQPQLMVLPTAAITLAVATAYRVSHTVSKRLDGGAA